MNVFGDALFITMLTIDTQIEYLGCCWLNRISSDAHVFSHIFSCYLLQHQWLSNNNILWKIKKIFNWNSVLFMDKIIAEINDVIAHMILNYYRRLYDQTLHVDEFYSCYYFYAYGELRLKTIWLITLWKVGLSDCVIDTEWFIL